MKSSEFKKRKCCYVLSLDFTVSEDKPQRAMFDMSKFMRSASMRVFFGMNFGETVGGFQQFNQLVIPRFTF